MICSTCNTDKEAFVCDCETVIATETFNKIKSLLVRTQGLLRAMETGLFLQADEVTRQLSRDIATTLAKL